MLRTIRDILCDVFVPFKCVLSSTSPLTVLLRVFAFSLTWVTRITDLPSQVLYFTDVASTGSTDDLSRSALDIVSVSKEGGIGL